MAKAPLHVAIVGGGLCGLSLAIALTKRGIAHTIYESHGSFTEIGAGINLGPNTVEAFKLIDPDIGNEIFSFATRNPGRRGDLWMIIRLGAATGEYEDAESIHEISTLPSKAGCMTVSRNELLQFLAQRTRPENARFHKKLKGISQSEEGATLTFADGSSEIADVVIGCDGIHSATRRIVCGSDSPAAKARFTKAGVYRAVFPMDEFEQLVGPDQTQVSTIRLGPGGYIISYPIDGGKNMNIGYWGGRDSWDQEAWIIPNQKQQMLRKFADWGPTAQRIMDAMGDETAFWATHDYGVTPDNYFKGRVCIIGDAAHAMSPHQAQGASQASEDACVMAEVLQAVDSTSHIPLGQQIEAAFTAFETIRRPRFEAAMRSSDEAHHKCWSTLWRPGLSREDVEAFRKMTDARFPWLWQADIAGQNRRALDEMRKILATGNGAV